MTDAEVDESGRFCSDGCSMKVRLFPRLAWLTMATAGALQVLSARCAQHLLRFPGGFQHDFGPSTPFGSDDAISGGAKRPASVVAKKAGCYKFSTGACISGEIQGMCGTGQAEAIVVGAGSH